MGGGQGQSKVGQEADRALAEISTTLYNITKGLRAETIGQITEGLQTGDIQAQHPQIQQAVEGAMAEGAVKSNQLLDQAAATGQARTPFAQKQLALQRLQAAQKAGMVPADYIQAFIRAGEPILYGQAPETAITGLGSLADIGAAKSIAGANQQNALINSLISGGGQLAAAGIGAYSAQPSQLPANVRPTTPLYTTRA